jgi:hypothetical protein
LATAKHRFKLHDFLRLHAARAAVLVIAAATLLALTGARSADAPVASPPAADFDRLAQAPSDQPPPPNLGDDEETPEDTLDVAPPPTVQQQVAPDSTTPAAAQQAPPDTLPMATPDTLRAASPDTLNMVPPGAMADSTAAHSARPDTLFAPTVLPAGPPGTASPPPSTGAIGPKEGPKKPRTGIFGVHPIAILLGLAALHIAVTHLVD